MRLVDAHGKGGTQRELQACKLLMKDDVRRHFDASDEHPRALEIPDGNFRIIDDP